MNPRKPTAIIVGGGPVGLTAALGLTRANIDFTLLERRNTVVVEDGSDMTLLPMIMPALDQLNLLEALSKVWNPVRQIERIDYNGRAMGELRIFHYVGESTGHYPCILSRRDLLHILHDALPKHAQSRVLADKKVSQIRRTDSGVTVSCTDGTTYHGTFVIGADGAFSTVRSAMRELALDAGSREVNEAEPFTTRYQALWVRFPTATMPFGKPGSAAETHGPGIATQLFSGEESSTVGLYRQLATPTRTSSRYDDKDEAALVREWEHLPLLVQKCADATGGGVLRLRDVYQARLGSGLVSLEEGVLPLWSWDGHVVLVGDAAHKFTPSTGSGLNYGMMDVVALINELHALLSHHDHGRGDSSQPWCSPAALAKAFRAYQQKRMAEVTAGCQQAGGATAMATWSNVGLRLLDQYILPMSFVQSFIGSRITSRARSAKPLAFEC